MTHVEENLYITDQQYHNNRYKINIARDKVKGG